MFEEQKNYGRMTGILIRFTLVVPALAYINRVILYIYTVGFKQYPKYSYTFWNESYTVLSKNFLQFSSLSAKPAPGNTHIHITRLFDLHNTH